MDQALTTMLPMLAFMLIPVWIPMIAVVVGAAGDKLAALRGVTKDVVSADAIKARVAAQHSAHQLAQQAA